MFAFAPELDLTVSRLFHDPAAGFALAGNRFWDGVVLANKVASGALVAAAIVILLAALLRRGSTNASALRYGAYVVLLYLTGPGLLVNGILKPIFGRARPVQIEAFGGASLFTGAWRASDQCQAACSFVSGEVAAGTALAVALAVGASWFSGRPIGRLLLGLARVSLVLLLFTAVQRVGSGRHFLSDVVFAFLPVSALGIALACPLRPSAGPTATQFTGMQQ